MKTKESSHRSGKYALVIRVSIFTVAALVCVFLLNRILGNAGAIVTTPVYTIRTWFAESSAVLPQYLRSRGELVRQIDDLREALASHSGSDSIINQLRQRNEELEKLLSHTDDERIAAGVIGRPPFVPYDGIIIDRGSTDGVVEGGIVYYEGDVALGYVSKVFAKSALVTLFSNPGVEATVYISGPNIYASAYGEGGGVLRISVPQGVPVAPKDTVILPALGLGILGVVKEVESIPTEPEQNAFVVSDIPIQSLHLVAVSKRTAEKVSYSEAETILREQNYGVLIIDDAPLSEPSATSTEAGTGSTTPETMPATATSTPL